ncbi:hypothetical protein Q9L58_001916 [Maublancomyces gigas]|uniref:Uncharacterized protein n=1 Tax=Discina gigas TaxID=1032678 RepID=A0ABR3GSW5_9PEZI
MTTLLTTILTTGSSIVDRDGKSVSKAVGIVSTLGTRVYDVCSPSINDVAMKKYSKLRGRRQSTGGQQGRGNATNEAGRAGGQNKGSAQQAGAMVAQRA